MSNIVLTSDGFTGIGPLLFQKYIADRNKFSCNNIYVHIDNLKTVLDKLNELYKYEISTFDLNSGKKTYYIAYTNQDDMFDIIIDPDTEETVGFEIHTSSIKISETIYNIISPYFYKGKNAYIEFNHFYTTKTGSIEKAKAIKDYDDYADVSKLYYPFLNTDEMFKQFMLSKETLLVLTGEPGTGKTKIAELAFKYLIENPDIISGNSEINPIDDTIAIRVGYIKNPEILSRDEFWVNLSHTDEPYDLIVLDDIDYMLTSRTNSNDGYKSNIKDSFISNFLSFSDGLFSSEYSTKFILATNQGIDHIDQAIIRKGRCFDILSFRKLTKKEAINIWKDNKLPMSIFKTNFKDTDVIQACVLGSLIGQTKAAIKKNTKLSNYILESGVSIYNTTKPKNIGVI